jgi:hypothetical protein
MKNEIIVLDHTGDSNHIWDPENEVEVEAAKQLFDSLKKKGYVAYKVEGKKGEKGEVMREWDPDAGRMIMAPPMRGG